MALDALSSERGTRRWERHGVGREKGLPWTLQGRGRKGTRLIKVRRKPVVPRVKTVGTGVDISLRSGWSDLSR